MSCLKLDECIPHVVCPLHFSLTLHLVLVKLNVTTCCFMCSPCVSSTNLKYTRLLQDIHSLIMSLNFTQIEIKTANFINSWGDGVLVMVSGLVQTKEYSHQRKFIQMFFLAPQEKGYFVLNDYFHFVDQEQVQPAQLISHDDYENNLASNTAVETGM